jgi:CheY-like chemotaxis protein
MALLNLVVNARDAMPDGGTLTIAARMAEPPAGGGLRPGRYVSLSVSDTGVGMDAETMNRAIEPFFSTKGIGKGTGLGLSMIHGLAAQLGGRLDLASTPGVGTTVQIWLPVAEGEVAQAALASTSDDRDNLGAGTVLLVDDEDVIRTTTSQMLADLGYTVVEVSSAREALPQLLDPRLTILVTDHLMPGMSGTELARRCQAIRPRMPILIISGYAEVEDVASDLPRLMKPFREAELADVLGTLKFDWSARR